MAVHIFVADEDNFNCCIRHGLAAIPAGKEPHINDELISRMAAVRSGDRLLFYVKSKKEIRGVYKAVGEAFYEDNLLIPAFPEGKSYPFRVRMDTWDYVFQQALSLSDMFDLRDMGRLWTFGLSRPSGTAN